MRDYNARYQFRLKERMDQAGYGVYLLERRGEQVFLAKPFNIQMEALGEPGGMAYFGDKEASFYLSYEAVKKDRVFDQVVEALVEAGLRESDKELAGEHRATKKQLEREQALHDRTFNLLHDTQHLQVNRVWPRGEG